MNLKFNSNYLKLKDNNKKNIKNIKLLIILF